MDRRSVPDARQPSLRLNGPLIAPVRTRSDGRCRNRRLGFVLVFRLVATQDRTEPERPPSAVVAMETQVKRGYFRGRDSEQEIYVQDARGRKRRPERQVVKP